MVQGADVYDLGAYSFGDDYDPRLYRTDVVADGVPGLAAVDDAALEQYLSEGFLVIHDAFTDDQMDEANQAILELIGAPDFNGIQFEGPRAASEGLPPAERVNHVRKLHDFAGLDPRLDAIASDPQLIAVLERVLEGPTRVVQDMALLKPPGGREKPWHQDLAYFNLPIETRVVGVWIAVDDASVEAGCMRVIPRAHREGPAPHFKVRDWQMCDTDVPVQRIVAAALRPGGVLLFDALMPHGTPANDTARARKALQYHYCRADAQPIRTEDRLAVFGGERLGATC